MNVCSRAFYRPERLENLSVRTKHDDSLHAPSDTIVPTVVVVIVADSAPLEIARPVIIFSLVLVIHTWKIVRVIDERRGDETVNGTDRSPRADGEANSKIAVSIYTGF